MAGLLDLMGSLDLLFQKCMSPIVKCMDIRIRAIGMRTAVRMTTMESMLVLIEGTHQIRLRLRNNALQINDQTSIPYNTHSATSQTLPGSTHSRGTLSRLGAEDF